MKKFVKMEDVKEIHLRKNFLYINPDSGKWIIGDKDVKDVISFFEYPHSVRELAGKFYRKRKKVIELIDILKKNDIISEVTESSKKKYSFDRKIIPKLVILNLTYKCNLECPYCYTSSNIHLKNHMNEELAEKIISEVYHLPKSLYGDTSSRCLRIAFHGGEPLLQFNEIKKIIERLRKKDFYNNLLFTIQTNGTLLNPKMVEFFNRNNIHIGISIDGPASINNKTRYYKSKRGSFDRVYKAINLLKQYGVPFGVITVLSKKNVEYVKEIIEFFLKEGIKGITLNYFVPFGRGEYFKNELEITDAQLYQAYEVVLELLINNISEENKGIKVSFREQTLKSLLLNINGIFTNMCFVSPCGALFDQLSFDPYGNVYPCDDFSPFPEFILGNINKLPLKEIIISSNIIETLKRRNVENMPTCKKCAWKTICGGGCPAKSYLKHGHIYYRHIYCDFMKKFILKLFHVIEENKTFLNFYSYE